MPTEVEKNRAELESLQLDELREQANERKSARAARQRQMRTVAMALKMTEDAKLYLQSRCVHRKGGKNLDQFFDGNDSNYAVVKHTLSHGPTIVICQRCQKIWEPPKPLNPDATKAQREAYDADIKEYRRALALPTDNEPSGSVIFDYFPNSPIAMQHL